MYKGEVGVVTLNLEKACQFLQGYFSGLLENLVKIEPYIYPKPYWQPSSLMEFFILEL